MIPRNSPCPCGSGRKYKLCCGALGDPPPATAVASASARSLMARALELQLDADHEAARELYLAALAEAPAEPDILHMLGVIEYCLHDPAAAVARIQQAMALVPDVAAMRDNLRLAKAAVECRRLKHLIFDPDADARPAPMGGNTIHLLNTYGNPSGGAEWRAIELGMRLKRHCDVAFWSEHPDRNSVFDAYGVRAIDTSAHHFPQTGTLVIIGCFFRIGAWVAQTRFRRVILLYNVFDPVQLAGKLKRLSLPMLPKIELLHASDLLQRNSGLPGRFEPSPIDLEHLRPGPRAPRASADFVVGRVSRDEQTKFHPAAAGFFREIAAREMKARIMGGTLLREALAGEQNVELLPVRTEPVATFLQSLDCFTYRTDPSWTEAWGRVVTEAMAAGLPVVAHANGGYAQIIRHGENGFLFHSDRQALDLIARLRDDPVLRATIGGAARQTVVDLVGEAAFARHVDFYLQ